MRQQSKSRILGVAALLGVLTAVMVYVFLSRQAKEARSEIQVVTARHTIPAGTLVDAAMLEIRGVPKNIVPPGTVVNPQAAVGKIATRPISSMEPVSVEALGPVSRLSYVVPPFMRAVTVALDPVTGVGGFLKPGDHVDVIVTFQVNDGTLTKTVLQNVELLATGPQIVNGASGTGGRSVKPNSLPNATLAVRPGQAENLVLADSKGKIRLALRRPGDASLFPTRGVSGRSVMGVVPQDTPEKEEQAQQTAAAESSKPDVAAVAREVAGVLAKAVHESQKGAAQPRQRRAAPPPVVAEKTPVKVEIPVPSTPERITVIRGTSAEQVTLTE